MKKVALLVFLIYSLYVNAQTYFHIPDSCFASYLRTISVPSAMKGDSLDISSTLVTTSTKSLVVRNPAYMPDMDGGVKNISGILYFKSLTYLDCSLNRSLTALPTLPEHLNVLNCKGTSIKNFPTIPKTLETFDCSFSQVRKLPVLPSTLLYLYCDFDSLNTSPFTHFVKDFKVSWKFAYCTSPTPPSPS